MSRLDIKRRAQYRDRLGIEANEREAKLVIRRESVTTESNLCKWIHMRVN